MDIFKAYDIRGTYPDELNEETAEAIGLALGTVIEGQTIVVGRDMRESAPQMQEALIRGLTRAGKDVVNIGQVTTPMVTFAVAKYEYGGGVQTTASHNPAGYIGFKISRAGAEPMSYETGINEIERRATEGDLPKAEQPGSVTERDILDDYLDHLLGTAGEIRDIKVAVDAGNGMAGYLLPPLFERLDAELVPLYFELDGTFPNHEANPLKAENLADLQAKVAEEGADLGVAFDGDGDRVAFVDETGEAIPCDLVIGLIAREVLASEPGATILHDLRSSWAVAEEVQACGGTSVETKVGHSYIKAAMREHDAAFGGELSGHFYFRENFYCDSGAITLLKILTLLCREGKPLSELVAPLRKYYGSGEINSEVEDKQGKIEELAHFYDCGHLSRLDGLKVTFEDWWFNVRPSNTEPKLRLVAEAKTKERLDAMVEHLLEHIRRPYTIRRILFPTDFSDYSLNALAYAIGLAEDYSAEVHLLHVVPTPDWTVQFEQVAPVLDTEFFEEMEQSARERMDELAEQEIRQRMKVTTAVRRGTAFLEIVRYARETEIDLIVIATHGRTGLKHALFGSVAEKVVRKAPCPILSVRPTGHHFTMP